MDTYHADQTFTGARVCATQLIMRMTIISTVTCTVAKCHAVYLRYQNEIHSVVIEINMETINAYVFR